MNAPDGNLMRDIPSVSDFVLCAPGATLAREFGERALKMELRALLAEIRQSIAQQKISAVPDADEMAEQLRDRLIRLSRPQGRRAINATGILLHTGLGRSPLCDDAIDAIATASRYSLLQASLDTGDRSLREQKIQRMLIELTGCQAATVVNNNAAATMLVLNTLAAGKEVIISRGQLIEIGGSFRMTDVMAQSGAAMREVGTTNRTHLRDYESAINERTGAIIHVHTSNYRIRGFAGTPAIGELAQLGNKHNVLVIDDLGSGALVSLREFGLSDEPLIAQSLAAGADVACFSGDKLICGPQAGILCGRADLIARLRKNPYARMFRVCKMTLAALEATLLHFINGTWRSAIPFYRMLARPISELQADAQRIVQALSNIPGLHASVDEDVAYVGSGSIPDQGIPTRIVRVTHEQLSAGELAAKLRQGIPSVFARLSDCQLVLDTRTLLDGEPDEVIDAMRTIVM